MLALSCAYGSTTGALGSGLATFSSSNLVEDGYCLGVGHGPIGCRFAGRRKRLWQEFLYALDEDHFEIAQCFFGDVLQIGFVLLRENNTLHSGASGRKHFAFYAANREHQATERDLSSHRRIASDRASRA